MHLRVKCIALQEKHIIEVHRSLHFGVLEIRCTSIWEGTKILKKFSLQVIIEPLSSY